MSASITAARVKQVKELAQAGQRMRDIVLALGLSSSSVRKIRRGLYDHLLSPRVDDEEEEARASVWCSRCRCRVFPPCEACRLRARMTRSGPPLGGRELPAWARDPNLRLRLQVSLAELGLPVRIVNQLETRGLLTVNDLLHCEPRDLRALPNFAEKTLEQIYAALERLGFFRRSRRGQETAA